MKKNVSLVLLFLAAFTLPSFGQSGGDGSTTNYLKFEVGYISGYEDSASGSGITIEGEVDNYINAGIGIGSYVDENVRFEVLANYVESGDWDIAVTDSSGNNIPVEVDEDYILSLSLNIYRDFMANSESIRPYIGGGVGLAYQKAVVSLGNISGEDSEAGLGVNGSAGICVVLSDNACLEFGYRASYFTTDDSDINHEGRIGVRLSGF